MDSDKGTTDIALQWLSYLQELLGLSSRCLLHTEQHVAIGMSYICWGVKFILAFIPCSSTCSLDKPLQTLGFLPPGSGMRKPISQVSPVDWFAKSGARHMSVKPLAAPNSCSIEKPLWLENYTGHLTALGEVCLLFRAHRFTGLGLSVQICIF